MKKIKRAKAFSLIELSIVILIIGILVQVSVGLPFMEGHTEAKNAVALGIMIVILLFRPQGIFGQKERIS